MDKQVKAYSYTAVAVLLWSTVATAFKIALEEYDPAGLVFVAALTSTLSLLLVVVFGGKLHLLHKNLRKSLLKSAGMGLLNPFLYYLVLFEAYSLLPAQEAQPLNWTWPITLSLLSAVFLKQRLNRMAILAIMLSFCGVLLISTRGNVTSWQFTNWYGDLLAVGSSVLWALYWIFNLKDHRDVTIRLFLNFCFGTLYIFVLLSLSSSLNSDQHFLTGLFPSLKCSLAAIWIGLFEMGLTFIVWLRALSLSRDSASVGIIAYLTPFISLIFIHFVLREEILTSSIIGLILIVAGIALKSMGNRHR